MSSDTLAVCVRWGHAHGSLGAVSDATLAALYRSCGVFCYPSLGEGFGLPVLEAMAPGPRWSPRTARASLRWAAMPWTTWTL